MKKKLINFDVFKQIENSSITNAEKELTEASEMLAKVLGKERLDLHCIHENSVTFINQDGNLVHANYTMDNNNILLENIQELVLDEQSVKNSTKNILENMVDLILDDKTEEASSKFSEFFAVPMLRSALREGVVLAEGKKPKKGKIPPQLLPFLKKKMGKKKGDDDKGANDKDECMKGEWASKKEMLKPAKGRMKKVAEKMHEAKLNALRTLADNVLEFVDFQENGTAYQNFRVQKDSQGNISSLQMPTAKVRNEGKVVAMHHKKGGKKAQECRAGAMETTKNESNWIRAVNDLKRFNALSDNEGLQNCFENVAAAWPNLMFLTRGELAAKINEALENTGARNYDSETCEFLADGILRTAHKAFSENVCKIYEAAGRNPVVDDYNDFVNLSEKVLPMIDAQEGKFMQVFSDLYRGLTEVYRAAQSAGDSATTAEAGSLLADVEEVLSKKQPASMRVALESALYLQTLAESADMDGDTWHVAKPHVSLVGDNPAIHKYAAVNGSPGAHTGPFKSSPVSDGKSVSAHVEDHYTAMKGSEVYPNVSNPYVPKAGDFKIHGEKAIENDKDYTGMSGADVLPNLKNPYIPDHGMTMQDSLKLLMGSE